MSDLDERLRDLRNLEPRPAATVADLRRRVTVRRRRRSAVGVAAAAIVVVGTIGLWPGGENAARVDVVDQTTTTTTTTPTPPGSATTEVPRTSTSFSYGDLQPPAPASEVPDRFVAVTADGRLVVVDTATGEELVELASAADPAGPQPEEGPNLNVIENIALSPDGTSVWYSECCEPAGGALFTVPVDGSAAASFEADGHHPSLPASDRWVAAVSTYGALVVDADGGTNRLWWYEEFSGLYQEAAWSLDGQRLAVRTGTPDAGSILVVDPTTFEPAAGDVSLDGAAPLLELDGSWRAPVFLRTGQMLAARRANGEWIPTLADPANGETQPAPFDYQRPVPLDQDVDPTGEWILVLEADDDETGNGTARWIGPDGTTQPIAGTYRAVSW